VGAVTQPAVALHHHPMNWELRPAAFPDLTRQPDELLGELWGILPDQHRPYFRLYCVVFPGCRLGKAPPRPGPLGAE